MYFYPLDIREQRWRYPFALFGNAAPLLEIFSPYLSLFPTRKIKTCCRAVTRSSLERKVGDSNFGPIKSDTVLPTTRQRCKISSKKAVLPGSNDAEMGPAKSLYASA